MPVEMQQQLPITIGLVAGETSGDILGAGLIKSIKAQYPHCRFVGIAGPLMQAQGCETWFPMEELAVMGLVEVLGRLPKILSIRRQLKRRLLACKPDIFIGIDAPDFNIPLEYFLKKHGIKTVHYVSPSVWAWRQKRVFKIAKSVDLVLAFLPFEKAFYDRFHVPCKFIGHTLADAIPLEPEKNIARELLGLPLTGQCLAILPGSRHSEVAMLSPVFLEVAQKLTQIVPELTIVIPLVNTKRRTEFEQIKAHIAPNLPVVLVEGKAREVMMASDATLLASGTAALECMLVKCPMVVAYRVKSFTYWLLKKLVKTKYVSLPNLLADRMLVPELIQEDCTADNLVDVLLELLNASDENYTLKNEFFRLHQLIRCQADEQAAKAVLELIQS